MKRALARIDLGAISNNVQHLRGKLEGGAEMCAVVKANAYGHGMVESAGAALRGGAKMLAVATAAEAATLRREQADVPILVMGSLAGEEIGRALGAGAEITIWRDASRELLGALAGELGILPRVHVKHDSGMGRLGLRDAGDVGALVDAVAADPRMKLAGIWTHFATADDDEAFMREQLERFRSVAEPAKERHPEITIHAANSAATLRETATHFDMVRCGVAIYGLDPFGRDPRDHGLQPALELRSYVADLKRFRPGDSAGYGKTWATDDETWIAPVPIGYGDGWRRGLSNRASALVGGEKRPVVGTVSMDNITVDLGPETSVSAFDEVVLIGERAGDRILAEELAHELGTINYEVTTGLLPRVEREYLGAS